MAKRKRGEVVGVRKLQSPRSAFVMISAHFDTCRTDKTWLTWWIISLRMSTGRSRSLNGVFLAFSFPLSNLLIDSLGGCGALAAAASGLLSRAHPGSSWVWEDMASVSSGGSGADRLSSSCEGVGEAVLGVPGEESGEESMLFRDAHASPSREGMNPHGESAFRKVDSTAAVRLVVSVLWTDVRGRHAEGQPATRARPTSALANQGPKAPWQRSQQ